MSLGVVLGLLGALLSVVAYTMRSMLPLRLYYQNPKLGFHLMRLIVARLMNDGARVRSADGTELKGAGVG